MKVLFLCQRVPFPPDRGDRITTHHFIRHLLNTGAEVLVGCLADDAHDDAAVADLGQSVSAICAPRIHRGWHKVLSLPALATGLALTVRFFYNRELAQTVQNWLSTKTPDLLYVYSSCMAQYVLQHEGAYRLMQFAELDSDKWRQYAEYHRGPAAWIYRREARRLLEFETEIARSFDVSCVVSEVEKELFTQRIPGARVEVLPNGVDFEHFQSRGDDCREPHTLIFTGVMDYEPNVQGVLWFVKHCWPEIRRTHKEARLLVVGSSPSPKIQALEGQAGRDGRAGRDGIEVTGRVPETPPYFDRASLAIAPLHIARGLQNKVLEAMSMGLPVVATPQAARGLGRTTVEAAQEEGILKVEETAAGTCKAILEYIGDHAASRAAGGRAAAFVRQHFGWEKAYAILDRILAEVPPGK